MNIKLPRALNTAKRTFALSVPLIACWAFSASAYERIISATGNASEIIYELGLTDKLIAVDTTSVLPIEIMRDKPKIGYRRALSSEGILSMQPDLLILAPDAGPPIVLQQLQATKLPSVTIANVKTVDGVIADITMLADKLEATAAAKPMIDTIRAQEKTLNEHKAQYPRIPQMAFLMDGGIGLMALGDGTAGQAMLTLVGGKNAFQSTKGVKPVSAESLASANMDVIIIAAHGKKVQQQQALINKQNPSSEAQQSAMPATLLTKASDDYPKLRFTKAAQNGCIFTVGTMQALGFGPHFLTAANDIARAVASCLTPKQ